MAGGSNLPRRALGRRLRDLRGKAGKSKLAAALRIEISRQGLGRLEEGEFIRVSSAQYRDLLDFYGVEGEARTEVLGLIDEVKAAKGDPSVGWWRLYADVVNPGFNHFMAFEQDCSRMTSFQLTQLPGLLHTPDYRRWIIYASDPTKSPADAEKQLELMARRQRRLTDDPDFSLEALLSESVLRHQLGGPEIMTEQANYLLNAGTLPNVSMQVIPFNVGAHPGLAVQSFTLLEFPSMRPGQSPEPPMVYTEGFTGELFLEDDRVVERYKSAVADLRAVALSEDDTRQLVQEIAEEYGT